MCTVIDQSTKSTCAWKSANTSETHASRFEVPRRRISDPEVHHRPRSTKVSTRSHACIARERRVNRYYDPSAGQFLSVDPDVAETGQPYAYTEDDPLNKTDPLGLGSMPDFPACNGGLRPRQLPKHVTMAQECKAERAAAKKEGKIECKEADDCKAESGPVGNPIDCVGSLFSILFGAATFVPPVTPVAMMGGGVGIATGLHGIVGDKACG
jgi:hypothetical protein